MLKYLWILLVVGNAWGMENNDNEAAQLQLWEPKPSEFVSIFNTMNQLKSVEYKTGVTAVMKIYQSYMMALNTIGFLLTKIDFNNLPAGGNNELVIEGSMPQHHVEKNIVQEIEGLSLAF